MRSTLVGVASFVVAALALLQAGAVQQAAPPAAVRYEVYAIRYGTIPQMAVSSLVAGADRTRRMDIPLMVWLLKGSNGHVVLVDCGFTSERLLGEWKIKDYRKPSEALAPLGVTPDEVTDLVLTHLHWDHAGGLPLFPKARMWIQKAEYGYYTGDAWQATGTHGGIEPDDVLALVRLNTGGRVTLVDGDARPILPGITCYTGGRHTYASQYLVVDTRSGRVVVASDNVYLYENLEKHVPIAGSLDAASNLATQDRMRGQASSVSLIVPGHDPAVFTRFAAVAPGIVRID